MTSLPGRYGIGEIGPDAHRWIDELADMRQSLWQILPLGPTGHGNSPYSGTSSFASNELLISIAQLARDGLLRAGDLNLMPSFDDLSVDYDPVREVRQAALALACQRFREQFRLSPSLEQAFAAFCTAEQGWLDDYAFFRALKAHFNGKPWNQWPAPFARRQPEAMAEAMAGLQEEIENIRILQFLFHSQWERLRLHARERGISIIGDIPIFVAHDSADVWANPDLFFLRGDGMPTVVAGVPPDFFSTTGQRWGNPLYDWDRHRATGYAWWIARMRRVLSQVDVVRIDHFRGFAAYWEIPSTEPTAINGRWVPGPGADFFEAMRRAIPGELPIIAEDLGIITEDVEELRDRFHLPGMRVLQFAFGSDALAHEYLPENYIENCVAYTGTHDNDTTVGHYWSNEGEFTTRTQAEINAERHRIRSYFHTDGTDIHWTFVNAVMRSRASRVIVPLQDFLGLGSEARMNVPGVADGNWRWRFQWEQLTPSLREKIAGLTAESGRG